MGYKFYRMKLQGKYNRATSAAAIFVLILGSISILFYTPYDFLIKEVDDSLMVRGAGNSRTIFTKRITHSPEETNYHDQQIHF
jgi:hypothetical protein